MGYRLGIDVGSAFTSAAVCSEGRLETLALGGAGGRIPTVLFVRPGGEMLVGRAAARRALDEPGRAARHLPRRLGDPAPVLLGGSPYSAQTLLARLVGWVVDAATTERGEPPAAVTVTRPGCWSPYTTDLLLGALRQAGLPAGPALAVRPAPEAAAAYHVYRTGAGSGDLFAVYDLGAGTCDVAVIAGSGHRTVGVGDGMERFGGLDLDEALLAHVARAAGVSLDVGPGAEPALARLRAECAEAKELLSEDTETSIAVVLGGVSTTVTVTRARFEELARPALTDTARAFGRALRSVPAEPSALAAVLMYGGCSRIPLAAELLRAEVGGAVRLLRRPPDEIALGAALLAAPADDVAAPPVAAIPVRLTAPAIADPLVAGPLIAAPVVAAPVIAAAHSADGAAVGPSRRRDGFLRRNPWLPAGIAALLVPLLAAGILWGGRASSRHTSAGRVAARSTPARSAATPAPAAFAALERAERLPAVAPTTPATGGPDEVLAGGSVEVAPVTEAAYALFQGQRGDARVTVDAVDTDDGFAKLCRGEIDLAGASYPQTPTAACGGSQLVAFEVAHETLPVVVDPADTWAHCLTLPQLHRIFGKGGATNWDQVDPSFPDVPLVVDGPAASSVPYAFFNASVNGGRDGGRADYRAFTDSAAVARNVAATRGSVGYVDFPSLTQNASRVRAVEIDGGSGCVYPTLAAARDGQYLPLCKPLYLYVRIASLRKPAVAAFVRFYIANSATIAEKAHDVPRGDGEIAANVARVASLTKGVPAAPG